MFSPLLDKTMEVYIDDMLVKSKEKDHYLADLETTFEILRKYKMKLNVVNCSFSVTSRKFLGVVVSRRGIEADPKNPCYSQGSPKAHLNGGSLRTFCFKIGEQISPIFLNG